MGNRTSEARHAQGARLFAVGAHYGGVSWGICAHAGIFVERASQPVLHELSSAREMRMHEIALPCAVAGRQGGLIDL